MINPIVSPMTMTTSDADLPMTMSTEERTLNMEMNSAVFVAPVKGVKGDAEQDYRTGYVSISAEDIDLTGYVVDPSYVHTDNNFTDADSTKLANLENLSIYVNGQSCPVTLIRKAVYNNVPGIGVFYDDGSLDGGFIFVADSDTLTTFETYLDSKYATFGDIPTDVSQLNNDSGYIIGSQVPSNETDPTVPAWAKSSSKPSYTASEVHALPDTTVIPTTTSQLTNNSGFITGTDVPSNETDPTVPSWAKASSKPTYTASEVGALPDTTVIPSATSDLNNDSGFITSADIPTNVSAFNNDVPYAKANTDGSALSAMAIPCGKVDGTSTATAFTATIPGISAYKTACA